MSTTYIIIIVVVVLVVLGVILALVFSPKKRSQQFQNKFGPEYGRAVKTAGSEKKAQAELNQRQKHVDTMNIRPLSLSERERY